MCKNMLSKRYLFETVLKHIPVFKNKQMLSQDPQSVRYCTLFDVNLFFRCPRIRTRLKGQSQDKDLSTESKEGNMRCQKETANNFLLICTLICNVFCMFGPSMHCEVDIHIWIRAKCP